MRGEMVTVTRRGKPVAELRPVSAAGTSSATLIRRWHGIPQVDAARLRVDLDDSLDPAL
jgi:antitoxin (DNA-binding transcriptional repressor) of toxin-antitoxin stability system